MTPQEGEDGNAPGGENPSGQTTPVDKWAKGVDVQNLQEHLQNQAAAEV